MTNVTLNGVSYSIPAVGTSGWGDSLSNYLVALASGVLQKSGGAFTLTAEVDFGATYGVKSAYLKSRGTSPSTTGVVRLANAESVSWRNAANTADLALNVDSSNALTFNAVPLVTLAVGAALATSKGGTGLTAIGSALQVLRVNAGGTALEFAAAGGDVSGPASSTDRAIPLFNGTTGKTLLNSPLTVDANGSVSQQGSGAVAAGYTLYAPDTYDANFAWRHASSNRWIARLNGSSNAWELYSASLTAAVMALNWTTGALKLNQYTTAGILHNDSSGNVTSSGIVSADFASGADASASLRGTVNTTTQTFAGAKTFSGAATFSSSITGTNIHNLGSGNITSGTYTPTATSLAAGVVTTANVTILAPWMYLRVGNVVTVAGRAQFNAASAGTADVEFTLPVSSDLSSTSPCIGTAVNKGTGTYPGIIVQDAGTDKAEINVQIDNISTNICYVHFSYVIT